jgi:hypothetical protein
MQTVPQGIPFDKGQEHYVQDVLKWQFFVLTLIFSQVVTEDSTVEYTNCKTAIRKMMSLTM